ncbi:SGNH/GDSL hydrolase family protein [Streptomyces sp. NBC_00237]|uniref:SGNH/GDSL hydrolase family protein n=1 Tax=Streptomyces sp. NBC_00237 TaxID=2975687 RepID=UPI002252ED6D|nr:SGNH/GDSL hydrolase family protein [Streptomyces sp. NBC_00237]MCX5206363.1 SGNH/GDSL hydrolase family protein [Streptomyces sp. NBC_00237]
MDKNRLRYGVALVALLLWWTTGCAFFAEPPEEEPPPPAPTVAARPDGQPRSPGDGDGDGGGRGSDRASDRDSDRADDAQHPRTASDPQLPVGERPTVLYLGDSIAMESQVALGDAVAAGGRATVHSAPYSGTTLCDYLTGRPSGSLVPDKDKAAALVATHRPRAVVLQFWGNSWGFTPCMNNIPQGSGRYYTRYAQDAEALTEQIAGAARRAGIPRPRIIWVLQGPDAFSSDRTRRVNELYQARAAASGDAVADAGKAVSPSGGRYDWRRSLPCNAEERNRRGACRNGLAALHRDDDPLHFCLAPTTSTPRPCPAPSPGITRYTQAIASAVASHVN